MDSIERLAAIFEKFPGVGPRQARRFVQYLLRNSPALRRELSDAIMALHNSVSRCESCMRFFADKAALCSICRDPSREKETLMIVASDADLLSVEASHTYRGLYFVLGGTLPIGKDAALPRQKELLSIIQKRLPEGLSEIIMALPANPEGDMTKEYVEELLTLYTSNGLTMTALGRGLSTGSELEYADPETIKNALTNRR